MFGIISINLSAMRLSPFLAAIPKELGHHVLSPRIGWQFFALWLLFFTATLAALYSFGLVPRGVAEIGDSIIIALAGGGTDGRIASARAQYAVAGAPTRPRIIVPNIDINAGIMFPASADIDILNDALSKGVVHYPGSALPGERGNVFLFGHSTGLKVVNNKAYTAFNRLSELKIGDVIRLRYGSGEYWYKASSVKIKKADEAWVDLRPGKTRRLTLSTCRVFGAKEERYVVEAEFMKSYPLQNLAIAADTSS